jgi:hypothetical protein
MRFRSPTHPACDGTGTRITTIGLEERFKYSEGGKQYRCHVCGRWLRPGINDTLPYHYRIKPIRSYEG